MTILPADKDPDRPVPEKWYYHSSKGELLSLWIHDGVKYDIKNVWRIRDDQFQQLHMQMTLDDWVEQGKIDLALKRSHTTLEGTSWVILLKRIEE